MAGSEEWVAVSDRIGRQTSGGWSKLIRVASCVLQEVGVQFEIPQTFFGLPNTRRCPLAYMAGNSCRLFQPMESMMRDAVGAVQLAGPRFHHSNGLAGSDRASV